MQSYTIGVTTFALERPPDRGEEGMLFDDDDDDGAAFDDTGWFYIWPAALALCRHLSVHAPLLAGRRVLELGAGAGAPSLFCACGNLVESVVASDQSGQVVERLCRTIERNRVGERARALRLDWSSDVERLAALVADERIDLVLAADVVYPMKDQQPLLAALALLVRTDIMIALNEMDIKPEA